MKRKDEERKDVLADLNWCDSDFQIEIVFGGLTFPWVWRHFGDIKEIVHSQRQPPA